MRTKKLPYRDIKKKNKIIELTNGTYLTNNSLGDTCNLWRTAFRTLPRLRGNERTLLKEFINDFLYGIHQLEAQDLNVSDYRIEFQTNRSLLLETSILNKKIETAMKPFLIEKNFQDSLCKITKPKLRLLCLQNKMLFMDEYTRRLNKITERVKLKHDGEENLNIINKLKDSVIFDMTSNSFSHTDLLMTFGNGKKWIDKLSVKDHKKLILLQATSALNVMYGKLLKCPYKINNRIVLKEDPFNPDNFNKQLNKLRLFPSLDDEDRIFLTNIQVELNNIGSFNFPKSSKKSKLPNDCLLIEADKGIGIAIINKSNLLDLYRRANKKHGFILSEMDTDSYIRFIVLERNKILKSMTHEIKSQLTKNILHGLEKDYGQLPILRPLLKLHKLDNPGHKDVNILTARLIKAGIDCPLNGVGAALSQLSKSVMKDARSYILKEFGIVVGLIDCDEAFNSISSIKHNSTFLGIEADAQDMYIELIYPIVKIATHELLTILGRSNSFIYFFLEMLKLLMSFNYFLEPEGVYTTPKEGSQGFSIGCKYAADGSEIAMISYEIKILEKLKALNLLVFILFFHRYKDDLCIGISWDCSRTMEILQIIAEGYPESLILKFVVSPIFFDFVDIRSYIKADGSLSIKLLRKALATYDINRPNSNTTDFIKDSTFFSFIYRSNKRCNGNSNRMKQLIKSKFILRTRGFSTNKWNEIFNKVSYRSLKIKKVVPVIKKYKGRYAGGFSFDKVSLLHVKMRDNFKKCGLPEKFNPQIALPHKSIWNHYYSKAKLMEEMTEFALDK